MLYRPPLGRFKDLSILWHEGRYYLFGMYAKDTSHEDPAYRKAWREASAQSLELPEIGLDIEDYRNVWLATSEDGVHWSDVGPVIEDAPFPVWAMAVHRAGDRFVLNHGSFSRPGVQNVIKQWDSLDLINWRYLGDEYDLGPDTRWHHEDSRLDCMNVLPVRDEETVTYYGYATGPGGFKRSLDGLHWSGVEPPKFDWYPFGAPPSVADGLEIGGCEFIDGRYYLLGSWFAFAGVSGYSVGTLVGETPLGPFRAAQPYRLCGNSGRWVAMWARYCRTDRDLLVNGHVYSGYSYESGPAWLPPLKKAVTDDHGNLTLVYWDGNDALKGAELDTLNAPGVLVHPPSSDSDPVSWSREATGITISAGPEVHQGSSRYPADVRSAVVLLDLDMDVARGVVVEGVITATSDDPRLVCPTAGLFLEETPQDGTGILLHGYGLTQIGRLQLLDGLLVSEDEIGPVNVSRGGVTPGVGHRFRLLARENMFELYLDDRYVQTFNTTHFPDRPGVTPRRLGFIAQNGSVLVEDLRVWSMTLS